MKTADEIILEIQELPPEERRKVDEFVFSTASTPPVWQQIVELGKSIPETEWDKVPTDLSKNLDHYLYNAKRDNGL